MTTVKNHYCHTFFGRVKRKINFLKGRAERYVDSRLICMTAKNSRLRLKSPQWNISLLDGFKNGENGVSQLLENNENAINDADDILAGKYRLFSEVIKSETGFPDWHKDYYSGTNYLLKPYTEIKIIENQGVDIIVPWEMSRLQFIPTLIQAHQQTHDEKYVEFFFNVIRDWDKSNPYLFGVNWVCGMDVAIRATNLAIGIVYFRGNSIENDAYLSNLLWCHIVYLHERDIPKHRNVKNNHFLVSCILYFVCLHWFDEDIKIKQWKIHVAKIIEKEIIRQFRPDGGNFESSTHYHQFVLEAVLFMLAVVPKQEQEKEQEQEQVIDNSVGYVESKNLLDRIEKAVKLVEDYTCVMNAAPLIGDSSDGRILFCKDYFSWTPLETDYISDFARFCPQLSANQLPPNKKTVNACNYYKNSGIGLFKGKNYGALIYAMPVEPGVGGHNHRDKCSIVLSVKGSPVFVDPGTYCYTSDLALRKKFRATSSHNVLLVDGMDQGHVERENAFSVPLNIDVVMEYSENPDSSIWSMSHTGYMDKVGIGKVNREVICSEGGLLINDLVEGEGEHVLEVLYHLHPSMSWKRIDNHIDIVRDNELFFQLLPPRGWHVDSDEYYYSPAYREKQLGVCIIFRKTQNLPCNLTTEVKIA